ncbi:PREDICTED: cell wall / vacuolar inhibitor of fructosidase 1-like [Fragaria vesca subsp. vesca]
MDAKLIEQTCNKTPHPILCVYSLKSDPRSARADVPGLALIMVDVVSGKVKGILKKLDTLLKQSPSNKALQNCNQDYHIVLNIEISAAKGAITLGDPKFAEQYMNDASNSADSCEREFKGRSPLTKLNKDIVDVSRVASAIVKILE